MTVVKDRPREAKQTNASMVQSYLASLLYLREEAKRDGLDAVATILTGALSSVEEWINTGAAAVDRHDLFDVPLCQALDFLVKWVASPPDRKRKVALYLAEYEAGRDPGESATHSLPPVSKRRAN